jgi:hypothetical protein
MFYPVHTMPICAARYRWHPVAEKLAWRGSTCIAGWDYLWSQSKTSQYFSVPIFTNDAQAQAALNHVRTFSQDSTSESL